MRRKTQRRMVRPRHSLSPRPPKAFKPTARALPQLSTQDKADEQTDSMNTIVPETASDGYGDDNGGVGTYSIHERVQNQCGWKDSQDSMELDSFDRETCIGCNSRDGQVLVCSESGCPVAMHEKCMGCKPMFDEGIFYCPYCTYKRALVLTRKLKRKAMAARKALSNFIDSSKLGGNKDNQKGVRFEKNGTNISGDAGVQNVCIHEKGINGSQFVIMEEDQGNEKEQLQVGCQEQYRIVAENEVHLNASIANSTDNVGCRVEGITKRVESLQDSVTKDKSDMACASETHQMEVLGNEAVGGLEDSRPAEDSQHERIVENHEEEEPSDTSHVEKETALDGVINESKEGDDNGTRSSDENEVREEDEEQVKTGALDGPPKAKRRSHILHKRRVKPKAQNTRSSEENVGREDEEEQLNTGALDEPAKAKERSHVVHKEHVKQTAQSSRSLEESEGREEDEEQENTGALDEPANANERSLVVHKRRVKQRAKKIVRTGNVDSPRRASPRFDSPRRASPRLKKLFHQSTNTVEKLNVKVSASKKSRDSGKQLMDINLPDSKRKRFTWTAEEEDKLKEGVEKFSTTVNKNIPWRKILEFGSGVFNGTRTPADLKDKWRNLTPKEASPTKRR
ncbi:hypothetical protein FNV43_RR14845 [Rhamnella rubrinervis]|uniref:Myb-like domain-containing protein n=1 Tax=Rhamnella rubrinervis TaxID=2594499 RepID=A0A8K0H3N5_9ROSA|nr:hypothetical protein FNV43_RR14845 [Rhamnella rubrinervis]